MNVWHLLLFSRKGLADRAVKMGGNIIGAHLKGTQGSCDSVRVIDMSQLSCISPPKAGDTAPSHRKKTVLKCAAIVCLSHFPVVHIFRESCSLSNAFRLLRHTPLSQECTTKRVGRFCRITNHSHLIATNVPAHTRTASAEFLANTQHKFEKEGKQLIFSS